MGLMTEVDFNDDDAGSGHHVEFVNTITFGHDIVGKLGGYIEFFSAVALRAEDAAWVGIGSGHSPTPSRMTFSSMRA